MCVRLTLHARVGSAAFLTAAASVAAAATAALIAHTHTYMQKAAQFAVANKNTCVCVYGALFLPFYKFRIFAVFIVVVVVVFAFI